MATGEKTLDQFTQAGAKPSLFSLLFHRDADLASPQSRRVGMQFLMELIYDKLVVEDAEVSDPTALSPTKGQQWIVASGASGAWDTHSTKLARWDGTAWDFATPTEGWRLYSKEQNQVYLFDGSSWIVDRRLPTLGSAGERLRVNSGETDLEFHTGPKAGTDTIADSQTSESVAFATAFPNANYSVAVIPDGDETIWIDNKAAGGFDLVRSASSGDRVVDWIAMPHEDL